jgi:hypothetical protein
MEMSMMTLEVDGGLSNPIVLASMGIWLAVLLLVFLPLARLLGRRNALTRVWLWASALAVLLVLPTHIARVLIGTWLYRFSNPSIISVGFWGGASPLLVPAILALCWFIVYRSSRVAVA